MKLARLIVISGILLFFIACAKQEYVLTIVNSKSFAEKQVTIDGSLSQRIGTDSIIPIQEPSFLSRKLDEMISKTEVLNETIADSSWASLLRNWEELNANEARFIQDTSANSLVLLQRLASLNSNLLKFSGEVRFGDAFEKILYEKREVLPERLIKSVIYTHVYDQIFINLFGSSSLTHYHTTGGTIKLIQETNFPERNEMTLTCETNDVRYLDVFIRIPEWAVNPTVNHGNVKYVARPGEYCQISRKWKDGDEFKIVLKN
jgi:hypothetical protein